MRAERVGRRRELLVQALCGLLCLGVLPETAGARFQGPVPPSIDLPVRETVEVEERRRRYAYYFDHNALVDAVRVGDALIAVTRSGNLLRLDTRTLTLTTRAIVEERATAIARDERDRVIIGTENGRMAPLIPEHSPGRSLLPAMGRSAGSREPMIALWRYLGPTAISAMARRTRLVISIAGGARDVGRSFVQQNGRTVLHRLPRDTDPNAFLVDGTRLWLGADSGEFGGVLRLGGLEDRADDPEGCVQCPGV